MRNIRIIIILVWLFAVCSCGGGSGLDARFHEIDRLCDSSPEAAIDSLASINPTNLSDKDLNRYRLLWIKSRDKAYIAHKSDTLILEVIDYYEKHRSEGLYPEALYYGGRVYSDLGDLPTALEFFQKSLDEIPEDDDHLRFKGTVLSQTGRLLYSLRLDSAAIEFLEKSLQIDRQEKNVYGASFTHGIIASSLRRLDSIKLARMHMDESLKTSTLLDESDRLTIQSEFAEMLLEEGKIDSALLVVRPLPTIVDSITLPYCLAIASRIYRDAGITDTAYMYARQLTGFTSPNNKETGYKVIFSDELKEYVPKDTLLKLMPEYKRVVEDYLNTHAAEQAFIQNSRFNYNNHIKARQETEQELQSFKYTFWITVGILTIVLLATWSILLWIKYHKSKKDSQVMEGLILTDKLKEKKAPIMFDFNEWNRFETHSTAALEDKLKILDEIHNAKEQNPSEAIDKTLHASSLYKDLKEKAENKKVMGKDITWRMIEDLIESVSPGFDYRLIVITGAKITPSERKVAYLMKFGFTQSQIASLLAKNDSTISAHRSSIAKKIGYNKSAIAQIIVRL